MYFPMKMDRSGVRFLVIRFHPNGTSDVDPTDPVYADGCGEVSSIVYAATGIHTITLRNRHTKIMGVWASLIETTTPGDETTVQPYGVTEGLAAANAFSVISYVNGTAAAVTYASTSWICLLVAVKDL